MTRAWRGDKGLVGAIGGYAVLVTVATKSSASICRMWLRIWQFRVHPSLRGNLLPGC